MKKINMKLSELIGFMRSKHFLWIPLEKVFVLLVVSLGVLLLLMASTLVQQSQYDLVRQYVAAKRAYNGRLARDMSEAGQLINSLAKNASSGGGVRDGVGSTTGMTTQPTSRPLTDPPWLMVNKSEVKPVESFLPAKQQRHPFLRGYVIENPGLCGEEPVDLLIVVHSAVKNFQRRRLLRETWAGTDAARGVAVRRVFVLGRDGSDPGYQQRVNTEQASYGDVVQGDFLDSFPNLTLKAVTALRWVNHHCPQARFLLKADDDMFVNVFDLLETFLQRLSRSNHTVMCHAKTANSSIIIRDPKSRWHVPKTILRDRTHWPAFCSGYLVIMTTDVIPGLYRASFGAPYVPVDDAFVYGVLPMLAGQGSVRYEDISQYLLLNDARLLAQYLDPKQPLTYLAGAIRRDTDLLKLWQATLSRLSPWATQRAGISHLHKTMTSKIL